MGARGGGEARTRPALRRAVLAQQVRTRPARTGRLDRRRPPAGQVPDAAAQAAVGRRAGAIALHNSGFPISMKKAVILVSGGMDSAVVLAIAREQGFAVHALSVSYGQRHTSELDAAVDRKSVV